MNSNRYLLSAICVFLLGFSINVKASEFGVAPIKLFFDRQTRSAVVSVSNDAAEPLVVQISLARWSQDGEAKDVYTESEDFQFFPRLMTIPPKDRRVVRIGVRAPPAGSDEITYRLFITEILPPQEKTASTTVRLAFRFALPIFVAPTAPTASGELGEIAIDQVKAKDGASTVVRFAVRNTGRENFRIESIRLAPPQGDPLKETDGWYLLPGISRTHTISIEPIDCKKIKQLELTVKADKLTLSKLLDVPSAACRQ